MKRIARWLAAVFVMSMALSSGASEMTGVFSPYVKEDGSITMPANYRTQWVHLGSWIVPEEKAPGYGFHDVYTQPGSLESYRKTGRFADGTVLVKEIRKVRSGKMTTGDASWAGDPAVCFVMIKDGKGRFPKNANWGDGWGWALFKAEDPLKNASADYAKDCIGCHVPAKATDWVFIEGYPTLRQ